MDLRPHVYVIDSEPVVLQSLNVMLQSCEYGVETFSSAEQFLDFLNRSESRRPRCLVTEYSLPGIDGLQLQREIAQLQYQIPMILLAGIADVDIAVEVMRGGAVDFLTKPVRFRTLLNSVRRAIELDERNERRDRFAREIQSRLKHLTARQCDVLIQVMEGRSNKQISAELHIGIQTVCKHVARILEIMEVESPIELVNSLHNFDWQRALQKP